MFSKSSRLVFAVSLIIISFVSGNCFAQEGSAQKYSGPYLGQTPPGKVAEIFAPGMVSSYAGERDMAITPDGREIYFCRQLGDYSVIVVTKELNGIWQKPVVAPFSGKYIDVEPAISPDGNRIFWVSKRPGNNGKAPMQNFDIWLAERKGDSWGAPENLGAPVNNELNQFFPSITNDGSIYFNQRDKTGEFIFKSQFKNGKYQEPVKLPKEINAVRFQFNAFIAPDESYIIIPSAPRKGAIGGIDYYINFRKPDGTWSASVNMGPKINTASRKEFSGFVSRDSKYFFFLTDRVSKEAKEMGRSGNLDSLMKASARAGNGSLDIYWIDAAVIQELRPQ